MVSGQDTLYYTVWSNRVLVRVMQKFQHLYNFKVLDDNTIYYTVFLTRVLDRVMPIFSSFMFAYQIHNPVHCWSPSPFLVGVPTISSFNCGSPSHTHFYFYCGSPRHSFLFLSFFLAGVPAHSFLFLFLWESPPYTFLFLAGVPAS